MEVHDDWLLTAARAAVHRPTATAVVADLHLGYGEARCRAGEAVPEAALDGILDPLKSLFKVCGVRRLVIAGDLFEAGYHPGVAAALTAWLAEVEVDLAAVVPGNHDRGLEGATGSLPLCPRGVTLGAWRVVHGDGARPRGLVVQGHVHPWLRWGGRVSAPCYLVGPKSVILPAFSADARGVNVLTGRLWPRHRCCAIAGDRVLDFGPLGWLREQVRSRRDGFAGPP
jgi:metallophosphoesterase superfamily enzyme